MNTHHSMRVAYTAQYKSMLTVPRMGFSLMALLVAVLLGACSPSTVNEPFQPTRVVVFGDSLSLVSTTAAYTVNDGSVNNWTSQIAAQYGVSNVVNKAAGNAVIADVQTQVTQFGANFQSSDLVIVSAGFRDIVNDAAANTNNAQTNGVAFANVVRSLVANGAKRVVVTNVYDLAKAPAASLATTPATIASNLAAKNSSGRGNLVALFNDALKGNLGSSTLTYIGDNVRLVDAESFLNLVVATPNTYGFVNTTTVTCAGTAVDTNNNGLGLGINQANSSKCATAQATGGTATTYSTLAYNNYVFADALYPTPNFHRIWGGYVYSQLKERW